MAVKKMSGVYVSWPKPSFALAVKTNKNFRTQFHGAMMYAHYELSPSELKRETMVYLKKLDSKHPFLSRIERMDENRFTTIGKYMYILNHGADVPEDILPGLMPALERVIDEEEARISQTEKVNIGIEGKEKAAVNTDATVKVVISIQNRLREKAREVAGEVEGWIDEFCLDRKLPVKSTEDFINLFKLYDLKAPHIYHLKDIFERRVKEIIDALDGKDKDLVEAYSNYSKSELKKYAAFNTNLLTACGMMQEVAKVERVPRKKKPVSHEKTVAKLKFKKDDVSLGIVSLSPVQLIGAKEVWCYDVKTRKLTRYVADDVIGTLSVKGGSIVNHNIAKSVSKTLRKPVEQLAAFKKCSKVQLRTFMDDITTVGISPTGKLNENYIILKIQ